MFEAASELRTMNMGCSIRFGAGQPFFRPPRISDRLSEGRISAKRCPSMRFSRRSFGNNCIAMLGATMIPAELWAALGETFKPFPSALPPASSGPPKMIVEDFSKVFDPAYLSNGLIGIRPGPNPLARALTCASGFVFAHHAHRVETLSPAPYPLETDICVKGLSLLKHQN